MIRHPTNHLLTDAAQTRLWVVCESGNRWLTATRRFITQIMPDDVAAEIRSANPDELRSLLAHQRQATVLYEVTPESVLKDIDSICRTTTEFPTVLQIAATSGMPGDVIAMLSEMGVTTSIRHPEQLPQLNRLVQRHVTSVP